MQGREMKEIRNDGGVQTRHKEPEKSGRASVGRSKEGRRIREVRLED